MTMYYTLYFRHVKLSAHWPKFCHEICQYYPYLNIPVTIALNCYYFYIKLLNTLIFCHSAITAIKKLTINSHRVEKTGKILLSTAKYQMK